MGLEGACEMLDRGQAEMVGGLVEDQQVHAPGLEQRQGRPGPLARRQRARRAQHVAGHQSVLGQQRPDVLWEQAQELRRERLQQRDPAVEQAAGLVHLADLDASDA